MTSVEPRKPATAHDFHQMMRVERGRDLTDEEIACALADHQTPIRHGTAEIGWEIAAQLRDRIEAEAAAPQPAAEAVALRAETLQSKIEAEMTSMHDYSRGFTVLLPDTTVAEIRTFLAALANQPATPAPAASGLDE